MRPTCHLGFDKCEGNIHCSVLCLGYCEYRDSIVKKKCTELELNAFQATLCSHWTNAKRIEREKESIAAYINEFNDIILNAAKQWKESLATGPGVIEYSKKILIGKITEISKEICCQEWYAEEIFEAIKLIKMPQCLHDIFYDYCGTQYHVYGMSKYNDGDGHPNGYANLVKFLRILNGDSLDDEKYGMFGNKKTHGVNLELDHGSFINAFFLIKRKVFALN
jgi:hypothetical protein